MWKGSRPRGDNRSFADVWGTNRSLKGTGRIRVRGQLGTALSGGEVVDMNIPDNVFVKVVHDSVLEVVEEEQMIAAAVEIEEEGVVAADTGNVGEDTFSSSFPHETRSPDAILIVDRKQSARNRCQESFVPRFAFPMVSFESLLDYKDIFQQLYWIRYALNSLPKAKEWVWTR